MESRNPIKKTYSSQKFTPPENSFDQLKFWGYFAYIYFLHFNPILSTLDENTFSFIFNADAVF